MSSTGDQRPIFITGAGGFIGRRLAAALIADNQRVRALLLPDEPAAESWSENGRLQAGNSQVEIVRGDVTDAETMAQAVTGAGSVIHLAAVVGDWGPESLFQRVAVDGTRHVLGAAAEQEIPALLISSIVVYGHQLGSQICHEDLEFGRPKGPYSRAKQAQERLAWNLVKSSGLRLKVVRPANVYGVGSRPWVEMVLPLLRRRRPALIGGGDFNAGLCHVDNLVDLILRVHRSEAAEGRIYNAADDSTVTWKQYFSDLAAAIGAPPPLSTPRALASPLAAACEGVWRLAGLPGRPLLTHEALNLAGSNHQIPIERARREIGFEPQVSYEQAIDRLRRHLAERRRE